jgi:hypothetical protein
MVETAVGCGSTWLPNQSSRSRNAAGPASAGGTCSSRQT